VRFNSTYVIALVCQEVEDEPPVHLITPEEQDALLADTDRLRAKKKQIYEDLKDAVEGE
jgi:hypothetical protein